MKINQISVSNKWDVPNQFEIITEDGKFFQSYRSMIAFRPYDKEKAFFDLFVGKCLHDEGLLEFPEVYLDKNDWNYSQTTGKYRNRFLGEDKKETERKIKSGQYKLADLNA